MKHKWESSDQQYVIPQRQYSLRALFAVITAVGSLLWLYVTFGEDLVFVVFGVIAMAVAIQARRLTASFVAVGYTVALSYVLLVSYGLQIESEKDVHRGEMSPLVPLAALAVGIVGGIFGVAIHHVCLRHSKRVVRSTGERSNVSETDDQV